MDTIGMVCVFALQEACHQFGGKRIARTDGIDDFGQNTSLIHGFIRRNEKGSLSEWGRSTECSSRLPQGNRGSGASQYRKRPDFWRETLLMTP